MGKITFSYVLAVAVCSPCLSGCAADGQGGLVRVANLPPVSAQACPDLTHWIMLSCMVPPDAKIPGDELSCKKLPHSLTFAASPATDCVAYVDEGIFSDDQYWRGGERLCLRTYPDTPERVIFTVPYGAYIRSPRFSPGGDKLAFLVQQRTSRGKPSSRQHLYVAELTPKSDGLYRLRDCGLLDGNWATIVWRNDSKTILWVSANGRVAELDLSSGKRSFHEKADMLFAATKEEFLAIRKRTRFPTGSRSWILMSISRKDGRERVIARIEGRSTPYLGLLVPDTSVLSLVVDYQINEKTFTMPTIFIDTVSGAVLGKVEFSVNGYAPRKLVVRPRLNSATTAPSK